MTQRILLAVGAVLGSMLSIVVGRADDHRNIQWLYNACKERDDQLGFVICLGYVSGIGDLMQMNAVAALKRVIDPSGWDDRLCGQPSYGAQVQAFVNWAERHPEKWQFSRQLGVVAALREALAVPMTHAGNHLLRWRARHRLSAAGSNGHATARPRSSL